MDTCGIIQQAFIELEQLEIEERIFIKQQLIGRYSNELKRQFISVFFYSPYHWIHEEEVSASDALEMGLAHRTVYEASGMGVEINSYKDMEDTLILTTGAEWSEKVEKYWEDNRNNFMEMKRLGLDLCTALIEVHDVGIEAMMGDIVDYL